MRTIFLLCCLILLSSQLRANDERSYSLRQPTAEEYLSALPSVWGNAYFSTPFATGINYQFGIEYLIDAELLYRFPEFMATDRYITFEAYAAFYHNDFGQILSAYQWWRFNRTNFDQTANHRNLAEWNSNLMELWLNQLQIDLDDYANENLEYFDISTGEVFPNSYEQTFLVMPVDFDSDGQNEWLLQNNMGSYLFVQLLGEVYQVSTTGLLWYDDYDTYINIAVYYWTLATEDINDDGVLDWIVHESIAVRNRGHVDSLIIYTLRENKLSWIFSSPSLDAIRDITDWRETEEWTFQNIDEDNALEILIDDVVYDWNGSQYIDTRILLRDTPTPYILPSPDPSIPLSPWEHLWAGKEAFEAGDYEDALTHFNSIELGREPLCLYSEQNSLNDSELLYDELCLHYWRGLTLEALGRNEEALQEYVYVLNSALSRVDFNSTDISIESIVPEFMWYYLASLHLHIEPPIELPSMSQG